MSTWLRPDHVFEHPAVEYIPIWVETVGTWHVPAVVGSGPQLIVAEHPTRLYEVLARLGVAASPPPVDWSRTLAVLALNATAAECFYRDYKTILLGAARPGTVQMFLLNTERFYKDSAQLVLYDAGGEVLASAACLVPGRTGGPRRRAGGA